jgi:predicted N-acyltransferase
MSLNGFREFLMFMIEYRRKKRESERKEMKTMPNSNLSGKKVDSAAFKERSFDICDFFYSYMVEKSDNGFLYRPDVYRLLCKKFSMKKDVVKDILMEMERREMIRNGNRGIKLCPK